MRKIQVLILFSLLSWAATAQDVHYSQFYMAPLDLNPALTGVMNCNQRLSANYRNQWASVLRDKAFQTFNVAYDARIPVGRNDYFGIGGSVWGDQAGSLKLRTNQLTGSFSYSKKMGGYRKKANYLVMGADVGVGQRGINTQDAQWGSQNNNGQFDGSIASGENIFQRDNFIYADVSAGLLWFSVFDENNNFYIGGAYDHINRANQSFSDGKFVPKPSKFTIHAGGEFQMRDRISLLPGIVTFLQGPYMQVNGGTSLRFSLSSNKRSTESLQFGTWARIGNNAGGGMIMDALILSTRFDYQNFSIGFSYDMNVSSLKTASRSNGGFEFALLYKICGPERRNVYCPNF
jgi:type IX secretion system PorP/SprF family membrane protein